MILTRFKLTLEEFIDDLSIVFPKSNHFRSLQQIVNYISNDYLLVVGLGINNSLHHYRDKLMRHDRSLFNLLENDSKNYPSPIFSDNFLTEIICSVKREWRYINRENQDVIWEYLEVLYDMSEEIVHYRPVPNESSEEIIVRYPNINPNDVSSDSDTDVSSDSDTDVNYIIFEYGTTPFRTTDECIICTDEYSIGENISIMSCCQLRLHDDCLTDWLRSHDTCIQCRTKTKCHLLG